MNRRDGPAVSRNASAPQVLVAIAALALVATAIAWLPTGGNATDNLDIAAADASTVAELGSTVDTSAAIQAAQAAADGEVQPLALPAPGAASGVTPAAAPAAASTDPTVATAGTAPADTTPADTTPAADTTPSSTAPSSTAPSSTAPSSTAPAMNNNSSPQSTPDRGYVSRAAQEGYDVHDFVEHTVALLGTQAMAPGQARDGGYQKVGPFEIRAWSPITGQRPVIEQAIDDVLERDPNATGEDLERKVAKRLTELNDWKNLNDQTQENMMIVTGVDIDAMDKRLREDTINHLLHSPLPFGYIDEVLSRDTTIDMGYTHTLDKDWTEAAHLGDGVFQIWMISNNNNGSHTGHVLGSFKVQLTPTTSLAEARDIGNDMVKNRNKNNKLYLAEAARQVLYGQTPRLDFSNLTAEQRRSVYAGRRLGEPTPPPIDPFTGTAPSEDPPAEDPPAEDPPAEDPPAEDPPAEDPPAEDPPAEDPPAEDPPAEDPPAEDPPAEDPAAEDPPAEDPPAEDPPAEDPPAEDPPAEDPDPQPPAPSTDG